MKKILLVLAILALTIPAAAHAEKLASLACQASNGVVLKSSQAADGSMVVSATWGTATKEFAAKFIPADTTKAGSAPMISLADDAGDQYEIAVTMDASRTDDQKAMGQLLQPSLVAGFPPAFVAFVSCDIQFE